MEIKLEEFICDYVDGKLSEAEKKSLEELVDSDKTVQSYINSVLIGKLIITTFGVHI